MQKKSVAVLTAAMLMAVPVCSFAAAWYVPSNVRVVQKSNTDTTGRVYSTIQAAINNISNASATNPYVVKVMPGVYSEAVTLKPYVTLEGSGAEDTIITASNDNVDSASCTVGTVVMANNSVIRNIKVINAKTTTVNAVALVFNNVNAKADNISLIAGSDTTSGGMVNGICSFGTSAVVELDNIIVETRINDGLSSSIFTNGADLRLNKSKMVSYNVNGSATGVITAPGAPVGKITIKNSDIEVNSPNYRAEGFIFSVNSATIANSTITLNVSNGTYSVASPFSSAWGVNENITLINTRIITDNLNKLSYNPGQGGMNYTIANSQLPGNLSALSLAKFVHNYDANFNPIPNQ